MFRIWKIKAESRLDALLARLKPSPLMARALPLSLLASLLVAEPAFAQANFEGLADNILGLLSNGCSARWRSSRSSSLAFCGSSAARRCRCSSRS